MKKVSVLFVFSLTLALFLITAVPGAGEGIFLPTPEPAETDSGEAGGILLATPTPQAAYIAPLPDLAGFLNASGQHVENYLVTNEYTADAHIYAVAVTDRISAYLQSCTEAGYTWQTDETFSSNLFSYRIQGGGYKAFLVPEFGGSILLLTEKGMPLEKEAVPEPYQASQLQISINGTTYTLKQADLQTAQSFFATSVKQTSSQSSWLTPSFFPSDVSGYTTAYPNGTLFLFQSSSPGLHVGFALPSDAAAGQSYTVRPGSNPGGLSFRMESGGLLPDISVLYYIDQEDKYVGLESEEDYFSIRVVDNQTNVASYKSSTYYALLEAKCSFEGSFCNGAVKVSGTFWYK